MLNAASHRPAELKLDTPVLMVLIDTEEEFDWSRPFSRDATATATIKAQHRAHEVFARYHIKPIYVIDYPVATRADGYGPLLELYQDGLCEIGAHLHPWVNPPFEEEVCVRNSYPGNLAPLLERAKLARLSEAIEARFGSRPVVYKAGRYGVGNATTATLEALGFEIDTSVLPATDLSRQLGPDFSACPSTPYWFGSGLLEIPMTVGFTGALAASGAALYPRIASPAGLTCHLPGVLARLGLLERITLTPEGITHAEHRRLTRALLVRGQRVFSFTYHSPSLAPGHTPYVRSQADLAGFLDKFERYFDFFMGEVGGRPATATEIRAAAL
jgi:hypothetical protein